MAEDVVAVTDDALVEVNVGRAGQNVNSTAAETAADLLKKRHLTHDERIRRYAKAVSVSFNTAASQLCSSPVSHLVKNYANAFGCKEEAIFFPLITCCASCIGPNAFMEVTPFWKEKLVLWTAVVSPYSPQQHSLMELFQSELIEAQQEVSNALPSGGNVIDCGSFLSFVEYFDMEGLHKLLSQSGGNGIGMYTSLGVLQKIIKHTSMTTDVLIKMYSGGSWKVHSQNYSSSLNQTCFNIVALREPSAFFYDWLSEDDFSKLLQECFICVCSGESVVDINALACAMPLFDLRKIFRNIIEIHRGSSFRYKFSASAQQSFFHMFNTIQQTASKHTANFSRIHKHIASQIVRLSCALHVLENAVEVMNWNIPSDPLTWSAEISVNTLRQARQIIGLVINQKKSFSDFSMLYQSQEKFPVTHSLTGMTPSHSVLNGLAANEQGSSSPSVLLVAKKPRLSQVNVERSHQRSQRSTEREGSISNRGSDQTSGLKRYSAEGQLSSVGKPTIVSVMSAGLPVEPTTIQVEPGIDQLQNRANPITSELSLPPGLSVSLVPEQLQLSASVQSPNSKTGVEYVADTSFQSVSSIRAPGSVQNVESNEIFFIRFKNKIQQLLMWNHSSITLALVVQMKFYPDPVLMFHDKSKSRQPWQAAQYFIERIAAMGLGDIKSAGNDGSFNSVFIKKELAQLGQRQRQMLKELGISDSEYSSSFLSVQQPDVLCMGQVANSTVTNSTTVYQEVVEVPD